MVADHDPESPTGVRCINCGSQGVVSMSTEPSCAKTSCTEAKAEDSVYCADHRDKKRAANQRAAAKKNGAAPPAPKITHRGRPPRVEAKVAAADPIAEIEAAIARRMEEIKTLEAAKALLVGVL
jgi:hypothetical protein